MNTEKDNRRLVNTITSAIAAYRAELLNEAVKALEECEAEIDAYVRQEYPSDHPVHERYRARDFSANPARVFLDKLRRET